MGASWSERSEQVPPRFTAEDWAKAVAVAVASLAVFVVFLWLLESVAQ